MKAKILRRGGYKIGQFDSSGGEAFGSVLVSGNPQSELEVSNVTYVSLKQDQLSAGVFGSGRLSVSNLPVLTGDISSSEGVGEITINSIGVSSNVAYPKVTVNEKGQVLGGAALIENDIPNLPFTKIGTGKPTDLEGYGITDALNSNGGTISGSLKVTETPVVSEQLVNLTYLDSVVGGGQGTDAPTGTVVYRTSKLAPTGFLRCNGGSVSKVAYANLYSIVGNQYSPGLTVGSGRPWEQQYFFNTSQSSALGTWNTGTNFPRTSGYGQVVVTKNRVYILGGWDSATLGNYATIYTAIINADGSIGAWSTAGNLPAAVTYSSGVVIRNRLYLFGGWDGTNILNTVRYTNIIADGTLGAWTTSTAIPAARYSSGAIVTSNRVYIIGGNDTNYAMTTTVWYATINADGSLGAWTTGTALSAGVASDNVAVIKDKVFIVYGNTYYTLPINADGSLGSLSSGVTLNGVDLNSRMFVTRNRLFFIGNSVNNNTSVVSCAINADGTLGTVSASSPLPVLTWTTYIFATGSRLYSVGGQDANGAVNRVYWVTLNGGLNDYSSYYATMVSSASESSDFTLPTINPSMTNTYAYIKT